MAFNVNKRQLILGVAFALTLAAVLTLQGKDEAEAVISQPAKSKIAHPAKSVDSEVESTGEIQLAKLNRQVLSEDVKEMFINKSWYTPPPPPKVVAPTAPPVPFVFKGKMMEEGEKIAVFLNKQDRSYIVREGDILDKNYSVDEIRPPLMVLTYLPLNIKQTISIGEAN